MEMEHQCNTARSQAAFPTHDMIARASTRTHVLVVDDEQDIAGLIKHGLEKGGDIEVEIVGRATARSRRSTSARPTSSFSISTCPC